MAAKKRRERTARERKRAGAATRPLSGNDGWMDGWVGGGITESSKERGGTAGVRGTGAICSTRGPPQGVLQRGFLRDSCFTHWRWCCRPRGLRWRRAQLRSQQATTSCSLLFFTLSSRRLPFFCIKQSRTGSNNWAPNCTHFRPGAPPMALGRWLTDQMCTVWNQNSISL